jgi:hypothetical protein
MTDKLNDMENPLEEIINEMMSQKMMNEIMQAWGEMPETERDDILKMFESIFNGEGEDSEAMFAMFHKLSMKHSKTYYFLHAIADDDNDDKWDEALKELI